MLYSMAGKLIILLQLQFLLCYVSCQNINYKLVETYVNAYSVFRPLVVRTLGKISEDREVMKKARELKMLQDKVSPSIPFYCNVTKPLKKSSPINVHTLNPADIDVVGAIGDSYTVGYGLIAVELIDIFAETRGFSWSGGGQSTWREYLTVPNILKKFNKNLLGFSVNESLSTDIGAYFNLAEGASLSENLFEMTKKMFNKMINDSRVDMENHWKMITMMIGGNDFCRLICHKSRRDFLDDHKRDMLKVLRFIRDHIPKTLVNLVLSPNPFEIRNFPSKPERCTQLNMVECGCAVLNQFEDKIPDYQKTVELWWKTERKIAVRKEFDLDNFTVVVQPFFTKLNFMAPGDTQFDYSILSQDCFHLTQKTNAKVANSLWNNMLERVGNKTIGVTRNLFERFLCPSEENPYIFTNRNSR